MGISSDTQSEKSYYAKFLKNALKEYPKNDLVFRAVGHLWLPPYFSRSCRYSVPWKIRTPVSTSCCAFTATVILQ